MLITHDLRTIKMGALVVALLFCMSTIAEARQFRLTGDWRQRRSAQLNVPVIGGIDAVTGQLISATGSSPADLTIPVNAFVDTAQFVFALPKTTIVQISTMFTFNGPEGVGVMQSGAKGTRPANFGFCPGAVPQGACTTPQTGGGQGTRHGIVQYTAGANQFGGTMQMLIGGTGSLSVVVGSSPIRVQHNTIGGLNSVTTMQAAVNGGAYSNMAVVNIPAGPITSGAVCAGGPCGTNGIVTVAGVLDGSGTNSTNTNTGFPWTTGMIYGLATEDLPVQPSTFSSTGSDMRSDLGAGNITLVAGGISFRVAQLSTFIQMDTITMNLKARNVPSISPTGIAALATMLIAGVGYATRRRFASKD